MDPSMQVLHLLILQKSGDFNTLHQVLITQLQMGYAESMVKIIKTAFTKAKYSGKDPQLALLVLHSTLVDSHLPSLMQLLYQWMLKTRLPTQPSNTDSHADDPISTWRLR